MSIGKYPSSSELKYNWVKSGELGQSISNRGENRYKSPLVGGIWQIKEQQKKKKKKGKQPQQRKQPEIFPGISSTKVFNMGN